MFWALNYLVFQETRNFCLFSSWQAEFKGPFLTFATKMHWTSFQSLHSTARLRSEHGICSHPGQGLLSCAVCMGPADFRQTEGVTEWSSTWLACSRPSASTSETKTVLVFELLRLTSSLSESERQAGTHLLYRRWSRQQERGRHTVWCVCSVQWGAYPRQCSFSCQNQVLHSCVAQ